LRYRDFEVVTEAAPVERPWNPPRKTMIASRPVTWRESLIDASIASAPEFPKNTMSRPRGVIAVSASARAMFGSYAATPAQIWESFAACAWIAATTFGCAWPIGVTAIPEVRSRTRLPSRVNSQLPSPWSTSSHV